MTPFALMRFSFYAGFTMASVFMGAVTGALPIAFIIWLAILCFISTAVALYLARELS